MGRFSSKETHPEREFTAWAPAPRIPGLHKRADVDHPFVAFLNLETHCPQPVLVKLISLTKLAESMRSSARRLENSTPIPRYFSKKESQVRNSSPPELPHGANQHTQTKTGNSTVFLKRSCASFGAVSNGTDSRIPRTRLFLMKRYGSPDPCHSGAVTTGEDIKWNQNKNKMPNNNNLILRRKPCVDASQEPESTDSHASLAEIATKS